jgi:hypothetical protein
MEGNASNLEWLCLAWRVTEMLGTGTPPKR